MQLIFANSNLGSDPISQVAAIAGACVGEDVMNFEFNQHLLVNEIEKEMPNGTKKVLDLNWAPVVNENDVVEQILLCVKDVTELRKLSMEAANQKRELEIIGEILGVKPEKFNDFISSALSYIDEIEKVIRANPNGSEDAIKLMFRNMHTIKGNARTYGLANLTNPVHDVESVYNELRNAYPMIAWDEPRLLDDLAQIRALVEHYAKTNEVSLGRKNTGKANDGYLMVDIKHIHETIKMLEKVSDSNIHDLVEAQKAAQQTLKLFSDHWM
jgi:two-component system chemotaxis sensor kinase CheA